MNQNSATDQPLPPPLEVQFPLCGVCGNETGSDGEYFECLPCGAYWPMRSNSVGFETGKWIDGDSEDGRVRCESIDGRFLRGGCWGSNPNTRDVEAFQCILAAEHIKSDRDEHHWADGRRNNRSWSDMEAATAEQLASLSGVSV